MIRSLLRMLKHITLAMVAIIAAVCIAEVGLRGRNLYLQCEQGGGCCELTPRPCAIAFQQLPPMQHITRTLPDTGQTVDLRTNRLGLRGPEVVIPKASGVIRIVCLGDDATFAADVAEEATFCALVQQQLGRQSGTPVEVVNAGIPGYCPLLSLAWARRQLTSLQPDLVILCCDRSDVADDRHVRPLARYADDGTLDVVCHPAASERPHSMMLAIEQEFQLVSLLRHQLSAYVGGSDASSNLTSEWEDVPASSPSSDTIQIRQTWEPIAALRNLCDQLSADFVVAVVPTSTAHTAPTGAGAVDQTMQLLGEATEEAGVPYLDVTAEFLPQTSPPLFSDRTGTLSPAGHQLFADLLSWAIRHRNSDTKASGSTRSTVMPASATAKDTEPPDVATVPVPQTPAPLPTLRRPRTDDDQAWAHPDP